jgi:CRP-like cAMP-binding protein
MQRLELGDAEMGVLARMLRQVEFFAPLTIKQVEQVLPHIRLYSYEKGETIFKQGDPGDAFYIVYTGSVSIKVKTGFFSFAKTVAMTHPGGFFGEMALVSDHARNASIVCNEPTQLFCLVAADFQFVLRENPATAAEMNRIAARRRFDATHK